MNPSVAYLVLANLTLIAALPRFVFRHEGRRFNLAWLVTAAPYAYSAAAIALYHLGWIQPRFQLHPLAAVIASAASILLIGLTAGSHHRRPCLWHQANDTPVELVTSGPYSRVRHPFYAAFLLAQLGALLAAPGLDLAVNWCATWVLLNRTAAREERRILESQHGPSYRDYLGRTGRFLPAVTR